jgi:hypothetical protein
MWNWTARALNFAQKHRNLKTGSGDNTFMVPSFAAKTTRATASPKTENSFENLGSFEMFVASSVGNLNLLFILHVGKKRDRPERSR